MDIKRIGWSARISGTRIKEPKYFEGSVIGMLTEILSYLTNEVSHSGVHGDKEITIEIHDYGFRSLTDDAERTKRIAHEVNQTLLSDPEIAAEAKAHWPQDGEDEAEYRRRLATDLKMNQAEITFWANDFFNPAGNIEYSSFWADKLIQRLMSLNTKYPPEDEYPTELSDLKKYAQQRYPQMFTTIRFVR